MIYAYNEQYLERARETLAVMFDYAVNKLAIEREIYDQLFSGSEAARQFECGNPSYIAGMSGLELTHTVLEEVGLSKEILPYQSLDRSPEYWAGWAVGYYQWKKNLRFSQIFTIVPFEEILSMYQKYHEIDIRHFCDRMDHLMEAHTLESNLKRLRRLSGYTQTLLAKKTGVPLRTIQQYEQGQKNINKAQTDAVVRLALELGCQCRDLLETHP